VLHPEIAVKKKPNDSLTTLKQAIDRELKKSAQEPKDDPGPHHGSSSADAVLPESIPKPAAGLGNRRVFLILAICLIGSAIASYLIVKYIASAVPQELVGTWQVTDGPLKDATLEFLWYGTAIATEYVNGKKEITRQSVKVTGSKILLTSWDDKTGKEDTVSQTILKLTNDELVFRDENRRIYTLKRVGN
jgi:uncharacterized protein (TIGR03066 family)